MTELAPKLNLGYSKKTMDNPDSTEERQPSSLNAQTVDFLPQTFEDQRRTAQQAHPLKNEGQIPVVDQSKPAAAKGLGLSTMAPPDVMDQVPQAVPTPPTTSSIQEQKPSRWKASLARMAFPVLTMFGISQAPPDVPETVVNSAAKSAEYTVNSVQHTAEGVGVFVAHQTTGGNARLEAGTSMQAAIPGPLNNPVIYNGPTPSGLTKR